MRTALVPYNEEDCRQACRRLLVTLACVLVCASSIRAVPGSAQTRPGELVGHQDLGVYSRERLDKILTEEIRVLVPRVSYRYEPAVNAVRLYGVRYVTLHPLQGNRPIVVTGLVALPEVRGQALPLLSYQHGTECSKHWVPSNPEASIETRAVVAAFAGQGYAVFMADYIGKGGSDESHPYMLADSEASTCRDLIDAGRTLCERLGVTLKPGLFLTGWSQGGHSTMALLRLLESEGREPLKAAAPIAGPYDLYANWEAWTSRPDADSPLLPLIMAYLLQSYEQQLGIRGLCHKAMKPPYDERAHEMFDRDIPAEQLFKNFPSRVRGLLREDFIRLGRIGNHPFFQALRQNQTYSWRVTTPVRLYHGQSDSVVPADLSAMACAFQKAMGANVTLANAGRDAGHREAFLWTLLEARKWFDTLK